jgi:hypothetical protein
MINDAIARVGGKQLRYRQRWATGGKTERLHSGNALATLTAAVSLRNSRRCIFTSFYSAGE